MARSRGNWERDVALLANEVQGWTAQEAAAQGRLILEPIARGVLEAQGRVDLYAWPSLFRVMLLHKPLGKDRGLAWGMRTESGIDWPQPWGRETFFTLAKGMCSGF